VEAESIQRELEIDGHLVPPVSISTFMNRS
jgi:hypothetical protein